MKKTLSALAFSLVLFGISSILFLMTPAVPAAGVDTASISPMPAATLLPPTQVAAEAVQGELKKISLAPAQTALVPISLSIPSIKLETTVVPVGINAKGEMDVPSGKTSDVGWYKSGTKPGEIGSAVLDAHVYAAFKKLKDVKPGDSIYVKGEHGEKLRFVVERTELKRLEDVSTFTLFKASDKARLNLITCAGTYLPSRATYDHRLVVYAVLAS